MSCVQEYFEVNHHTVGSLTIPMASGYNYGNYVHTLCNHYMELCCKVPPSPRYHVVACASWYNINITALWHDISTHKSNVPAAALRLRQQPCSYASMHCFTQVSSLHITNEQLQGGSTIRTSNRAQHQPVCTQQRRSLAHGSGNRE